jgi:hypothetical protein
MGMPVLEDKERTDEEKVYNTATIDRWHSPYVTHLISHSEHMTSPLADVMQLSLK